MRKILVILLLCSAVAAQKGKKNKKGCSHLNIVKQQCSYGKVGRGCIPRVKVQPFKWEEVTPYQFTIRWEPVRTARCYSIEILTGFSSLVMRRISCYKRTTFVARGLHPWHQYGVQVSAVNYRCKRGRPSKKQQIKTFWAPTAATTTTARPTFTPKARQCGKGYFTCQSNKKQCIKNKNWCDRKLHCDDGSDERGCPGGCKELKVELKHGNYSCTKWGSPGSFCFFDCKEPYVREGIRYTQCLKKLKKWSNPVPTCRLSSTKSLLLVGEKTSPTSLSVEWTPVDGAARYAFQITEQVTIADEEDHTAVQIVNATQCCSADLTGLKPDVEYTISMRAIDVEDEDGIDSAFVYGRTLKDDFILKSSGSR